MKIHKKIKRKKIDVDIEGIKKRWKKNNFEKKKISVPDQNYLFENKIRLINNQHEIDKCFENFEKNLFKDDNYFFGEEIEDLKNFEKCEEFDDLDLELDELDRMIDEIRKNKIDNN